MRRDVEKDLTVFDQTAFDAHERALFVHDAETGLRAIIAIHSTALGPAGGGCRLWTYASADAALTDALLLSRGMSYKNALAGLPMGGGKAVILGPLESANRRRAFEAFGRAVDSLGGNYVTAEDVGVSVSDMDAIAVATKFVSGRRAANGVGGDPSPHTARGVRIGLEAAVAHALSRTSLDGVRVALQGLGHVGAHLCRELAERGARLVVADIDTRRVEETCDLYGAQPCAPEDILFADVDVVAPCALGAILHEGVLDRLRASVIAGAANNQLATSAVGEALHQRGVTYAPDYLINAGGIIAVAAEYFGVTDVVRVDFAIERIGERTREVLERSAREDLPSAAIADSMARATIAGERREERVIDPGSAV